MIVVEQPDALIDQPITIALRGFGSREAVSVTATLTYPTSTLHATIGGTHCINCAGAAERLLRAVPDVESARVYYRSGLAVIRHTQGLDVTTLQAALAPDGYTLVSGVDAVPPLHETSFRDYGKIGAMVVVLGAIALALSISD